MFIGLFVVCSLAGDCVPSTSVMFFKDEISCIQSGLDPWVSFKMQQEEGLIGDTHFMCMEVSSPIFDEQV
tara:strand:+ start:6581 stop:6790 length:210 start_codon:yes stop_codon:yes gene_type:complete